ncbi:MAG TPA: metallophosphoesterase [Alphaproteobacteria bacterium]|nr:metallophosphoesterase [Alphaproteobacteria bacterium]
MDTIGRRGLLGCMALAGAGIVWTVTGGVPRMLSIAEAEAAGTDKLHFVQISDSHIGFDKDPNHDSAGTYKAAIDKIRAMKNRPAFLMHTGDITHLSKAEQFDLEAQISAGAGLSVHYIPGEHDWGGDDGALYLARHGNGSKGKGWYAWDESGVHFVALVNVADFKAGGFGSLGAEQLAWLKDDLADKRASTPIVVLAHIPLWTVDEAWGWKTDDGDQALALLKRFGSVTVLNGHIHQVMQKVEGHVAFHTAMSTAFPQPSPGTAPSPGPLKSVPADRLRATLGITDVTVKRGQGPVVLADSTLAEG